MLMDRIDDCKISHLEVDWSRQILQMHADAKRGSKGFGAAFAGQGAPPLGGRQRSTMSYAMTHTGAHRMPGWCTVLCGVQFRKSGCGRRDRGQTSASNGSHQPPLRT